MRRSKCAFAVAATVLGAQPAFANPALGTKPLVVPKAYDPQTGTVRPLVGPQKPLVGPEVAGKTVGGKIVTHFTISVLSTLPLNAPIECDVTALATDNGGTSFFTELAAATATRASATSASCTVTIPYSFAQIKTPSSDTLSLSYTILATTPPATGMAPGLLRDSSATIATIPLPANAATTTETVAATI